MEPKPVRSRSNNNNSHQGRINGIGGGASSTIRNSKEVGGGKEVKLHKKQIPKQLRYDLENALLGLCDVWFDEIKPHLISNKIKLHVGEAPTSVKNEHATNQLMACSHTDPATSSSTCELCRLLVDATNNIKHALSQAISSGASIDTRNFSLSN